MNTRDEVDRMEELMDREDQKEDLREGMQEEEKVKRRGKCNGRYLWLYNER